MPASKQKYGVQVPEQVPADLFNPASLSRIERSRAARQSQWRSTVASILIRRDQFNITPEGIVHKPTDSHFAPRADDPSTGSIRLGQVELNIQFATAKPSGGFGDSCGTCSNLQ
jgi:hypothetical protein